MNISVIVPMLNEERAIGRTLSSLSLLPEDELIVVDGGSGDRSVEVAASFTKQVLVTRRGRGHQLHAGATQARNGILLFLHADCRLPEGGVETARALMAEQEVAAGAFDLRIDHPSPCFRVIEWGANLRSRASSVPYGDQAVFMRKEIYDKVGGFADLPLMEDIDIAGRLKREGRIVFVRPPVITSPRRWLKEGLLYTTLRDWSLAVSYSLLGVAPEKLLRHYRDVR